MALEGIYNIPDWVYKYSKEYIEGYEDAVKDFKMIIKNLKNQSHEFAPIKNISEGETGYVSHDTQGKDITSNKEALKQVSQPAVCECGEECFIVKGRKTNKDYIICYNCGLKGEVKHE